MIQVYHSKQPTFRVGNEFVPNVIRDYVHVANVYVDSKDAAYELTNTIDANWYEDDEQVAYVGPAGGCRSTSVGDVMVMLDDSGVYRTWVVASFGFSDVTDRVS